MNCSLPGSTCPSNSANRWMPRSKKFSSIVGKARWQQAEVGYLMFVFPLAERLLQIFQACTVSRISKHVSGWSDIVHPITVWVPSAPNLHGTQDRESFSSDPEGGIQMAGSGSWAQSRSSPHSSILSLSVYGCGNSMEKS
jgi:hypothetical protein